MKNKKTKTEIKKQIRHMHEKTGAIVLALGMLVGTVAVSQEARRLLTDLAVHPVMAIIEHSSKEREVPHRAIRVDDGLRTPAIGGGEN